jgi:thiol:disulfide interchange protein DsbA
MDSSSAVLARGGRAPKRAVGVAVVNGPQIVAVGNPKRREAAMSRSVDPSTRRFLKAMAAGAAALAAGCATRDPSKPPEEGFEYVAVARPFPNVSAGRIEITEFFWYGCPFCNAFDPELKAWLSRQPADVALRKVHPAMNPAWREHQRIFYTLEVLGKLDEMNARVFQALHERQMLLDTRGRIADWAAGEGLDRKLFLDTMDSPEVGARCERATELAKAIKLESVPSLVVNGKWMSSTTMAGTREGVLRVLDYLVARERRGG